MQIQKANEGKKMKSINYTEIKAYIALLIAILVFSGFFHNLESAPWLGAFDFTTLIGKFGNIGIEAKANFLGKNGEGARNGFLLALSLIPGIMLALGLLEIFTHYGAIRAAQKLLTPMLQPILGIPGRCGLAMITDLQSTDAGAALTKELYDQGEINKKELIIMSSWQYSGAGMINNYYSIGSALFSAPLLVKIIYPVLIIFIMKFIGAIITRMVLVTFYKKDF